MLQAMLSAEVGDDVLRDDPTVHALERESAQLCGKESALFTPSGTMANQLAIRGWTQPGDEVLMEAGSHPYNYESAGHAAISGVQIRPIVGTLGILDSQDVADCIRPVDDHFAPASLLCVENTANRGGGTVYPTQRLEELTQLAHTHGLKAHLDGARVFNAVAASGQPLSRIAEGFDSVAFCLSKGLGAPVGSILCGPSDFIATARRMRKMLGGGMRQAGFLAAAGLYALHNNLERLDEDHKRASDLYQGFLAMGIETIEPQTNMVYATLANAPDLVEYLGKQEIKILAVDSNTIRLVTHLDVDNQGIEKLLEAMRAWMN